MSVVIQSYSETPTSDGGVQVTNAIVVNEASVVNKTAVEDETFAGNETFVGEVIGGLSAALDATKISS